MADETELNLNELDDEVVSEAQDEDEVEEVYVDDEKTEITSRELRLFMIFLSISPRYSANKQCRLVSS